MNQSWGNRAICASESVLMSIGRWNKKNKTRNEQTNKYKKLLLHSIPESETYLMDWYVYVNYENYEYNDTNNNNYDNYNNNNNNNNNNINNK